MATAQRFSSSIGNQLQESNVDLTPLSPLMELMNAFNILKKAEIAIQGKESFKVWGLLDHLRVLENQEQKTVRENKLLIAPTKGERCKVFRPEHYGS